MLKIKVKASGVNNLTDARYFAAREVEWLGFPLGEGMEGSLPAAEAKILKEWVDGVKVVGEFDFPTIEELLDAREKVGLDGVQVGMFTPLEVLAKLEGLTIIKQVVVDEATARPDLEEHLRKFARACQFFLLDFTKSAITWEELKAGRPFPSAFVKELAGQYRVIVALDCPPTSLEEMLEAVRPYGISLVGGDEEKVGFKSFDELDEILDSLETTVS